MKTNLGPKMGRLVKVRSAICTAIAASTVLAACGGGGDGGSAALPSSAEGVYGGTLTGSASSAFEMLVLENGEYWGLYGEQSASVFGVAGFVQGSGTSNNGSFTSSSAKDFGFVPALPGTVSATYNATAKTISGTVASTRGSVVFSGGPIAGSLYNYDTPALLSAISGSWSMTQLSGEGLALTVASSGAFTAASSLGCNFSGTVTPRPSGKNVYNLSLTSGLHRVRLPVKQPLALQWHTRSPTARSSCSSRRWTELAPLARRRLAFADHSQR